MRNGRFLALVMLFALGTACDDRRPASTPAPAPVAPPTKEPSPAPVAPASPPEAGPPKTLTFEITKVYPGQSLTKTAPWHTAKGDWTFFDARTTAGTTFTVGVPPRVARRAKELGIGDVVVGASDCNAGIALANDLAKAFVVTAQTAPRPKQALPPDVLHFTSSIRTENAMKDPSGDFGGVGGGWTATRWTIGPEDNTAEIDFNYNLELKQGEFSERNKTDDESVVSAIAHSLGNGC